MQNLFGELEESRVSFTMDKYFQIQIFAEQRRSPTNIVLVWCGIVVTYEDKNFETYLFQNQIVMDNKFKTLDLSWRWGLSASWPASRRRWEQMRRR